MTCQNSMGYWVSSMVTKSPQTNLGNGKIMGFEGGMAYKGVDCSGLWRYTLTMGTEKVSEDAWFATQINEYCVCGVRHGFKP